MINMKYTCLFCEKDRFCLNNELFLPGKASIIYENEDIYVTPDLFPLCLGHMLIITKEHYNSFGNTPYSVYENKEIAKRYLHEKVFKSMPCICFEHGAVVEHSGGASIDHAHMHIMPFSEDIKQVIDSSGYIDTVPIDATYENLRKLAADDVPYIYYQHNRDKPIAYPLLKGVPSQFLRMLVASRLQTNYDWKTSYGDETTRELFVRTIAFGKGKNHEAII